MLEDYKLTEQELKTYMNINLDDEVIDSDSKQFVLNLGFDYATKEIYRLNDNVKEDETIESILKDSTSKQKYFKWCQAKIIHNMLHYKDTIMTDDVDDTIRYQLRLSLVNGWQR